VDNALIAALLDRPQFTVDMTALHTAWADRTILITGAGGSIGSELVRQLSAIPCRIVMYDRSENNLVRMIGDLRSAKAVCVPVLGDVQQTELLDYAFRAHRPQIVIHAAAYKHVPLLETNPLQAVGNNIFGTRAVLTAVRNWGAETFVLVSTDKAVNPTSVMGATKRAAEMVTVNGGGTVVRLGNVLGSSGSVVPIFERQIAAGGPVTVTHPDATRFFMSVPEAAALILHAALMGMGGETFVLEMGDPVRIVDIASRMIARAGGPHPEIDIKIMYTGMRPGEKLTEQLHNGGLDATAHPRIWLAKTTAPWTETELDGKLWRLRLALESGNPAAALDGLRSLVPEYQPAVVP